MKELVIKAMAGDPEAFDQLVLANKPRLLAKAYSYLHNKEEALDVVQESFLKAYKSLHQLKEPQYFLTWIYKILIRESFAVLKRKKRVLQLKAEVRKQLILHQEEASPTYEYVHEALHLLRQDYQTAIILHYFYNFKIQEIAHMTDKPLNTIKMHLHRARLQLKKQLESSTNTSIKTKDVVQMLKEELREIAITFVTVPKDFYLSVDDYAGDHATFLWKEKNGEEGYYVELDAEGRLISLSQPAPSTGKKVSLEEQQCIAKQFLKTQYPEALEYFTLSTVKETEEGARLKFEQYVGNYPLSSYYCIIVTSMFGEVVDFTYRGYMTNPPLLPTTIASKENILHKLYVANWTMNMEYLSTDVFSVPVSGLYLVYESSIVHQTFDAETGEQLVEMDEYEETSTFMAFPKVDLTQPEETIDKVIGITQSMEIVRQTETEENLQQIVWREKGWQAPKDKTMDSFVLSRFEECIKARIDTKTNQLNGFVWFKERNGDYDYSFEQCRDIAIQFIATYYSEYIPYLQVKMEDPSFNNLNRAFFVFPVTVEGYRMDGEFFSISVNKTTGYIDMLMTPDLEISTIEAYTSNPIVDLSTAKQSLFNVDAVLEWQSDESSEKLRYRFRHHGNNQRIKGIDAVTGKLIFTNY